MSEAARRRYSTALGYLTALCGPVVSFPEKQPTAYSYNGVVLPGLPEWDKAVYPYAVITKRLDTGKYAFAYYAILSEYVEKPEGFGPNYTVHNGMFHDSDGVNWIENGTTFAWVYADTTQIIWTNTDIFNTDGFVYLAASEPVPVYE